EDAGEAMVEEQDLDRQGWKIEVRVAVKERDCSELMRKKLENLRRRPPEILGTKPLETADLGITLVELWADVADRLSAAQEAIAAEAYLETASRTVILDGLLGLGAKPPLRDPVRKACRHINPLREKKNVYVFAVDLPTRLDGDSRQTVHDCIVADFTVTIGFALPGRLANEA